MMPTKTIFIIIKLQCEKNEHKLTLQCWPKKNVQNAFVDENINITADYKYPSLNRPGMSKQAGPQTHLK